jgi:hypothetical protein
MDIHIFQYYKKEDFGTEHIFTVLKGKKRSFVQLGLSYNDYPDFPFLQISFGGNNLIDILFWCWKFSLAFEVFSYNWSRTEQ